MSQRENGDWQNVNQEPFESNPYALPGNTITPEQASSWLTPRPVAQRLPIQLCKVLCLLPFCAACYALVNQITLLDLTRLPLTPTALLLLHPLLLALAGIFLQQQTARAWLLCYLLWSLQKSWQSGGAEYLVSIIFALALLPYNHWLCRQR